MFVTIPPTNGTCSVCPACDGKSAAKALDGLIGVAVFVTAKYFYPILKEIFIRICGSSPQYNNQALQALILRPSHDAGSSKVGSRS